jgi:hypothetical protein
MATSVAPSQNGNRNGSPTVPAHLTEPSNGRAGAGESQEECSLITLKKDDKGSFEVVPIFVVVKGEASKLVDHSCHLTEEEATMSAYRVDTGGKDGKIEQRFAVHLDNGNFYEIKPKPLKVGIDKKIILDIRKEGIGKLNHRALLLALGLDDQGNHTTAPSIS